MGKIFQMSKKKNFFQASTQSYYCLPICMNYFRLSRMILSKRYIFFKIILLRDEIL